MPQACRAARIWRNSPRSKAGAKVVGIPVVALFQSGDTPVTETTGHAGGESRSHAHRSLTKPRREPFRASRTSWRWPAEKRDIKLKSELERLVRPIRVAPGQIEIALEPGAPPGLPGELSRKLEAWTGTRWMVVVAPQGGERPIALQRKETRDSLFRSAREHPDVQAIFKRFPGAEIVDVREPETPIDERER